MPATRRYRRNQRTSVKNRRRIVRSKPTARNQRRQILSNQNQITAISRHLSLAKERIRWHCGFAEKQITAYPYVIPLTSGPSSQNPALTSSGTPVPWNVTMTAKTQNDETLRNKAVANTQWVDLSVTGGSEPAALYVTAFLVQLQEETASQVYFETSNMATLTRGTDFATPTVTGGTSDTGYGPYMNTDRFKILKRMEFCTLGPTIGWPGGPPGGNMGGGLGAAVRRMQFKINYGNTTFKSTGQHASLQSLPYAECDPKHKRFIVIFSDNNLNNQKYPNVAMSSLITGYTE